MEKLIELFNKHIEENTGQKYYLNERDVKDKLDSLLILRYFIKWLVDNDKIDFSNIPNKIKEIGIPITIQGEIQYGFDSSDYYWLLMILSIQDNPIEFLISILK